MDEGGTQLTATTSPYMGGLKQLVEAVRQGLLIEVVHGTGVMGPGTGVMGPGIGVMGPGTGVMGPGTGVMGPWTGSPGD